MSLLKNHFKPARRIGGIISLSFLILFAVVFFGWNYSNATVINKSSSNNTLQNGLVGWWTFDGKDVTANTTTDRSGQGNNGTRVGTTTPVVGRIGQAMKFGPGGGNYIKTVDLDLSGNFAFSAWVKLNAVGSGQIIINKTLTNTNYPSYALYILSDNKVYCWFATANSPAGWGTPSGSAKTLTVGIWYHIACSHDGTNIREYINGSMDANSPIARTGTAYNSPDNLWIGADNNSLTPFYDSPINGVIDDVRVYNRALSPVEIQQLYRMGK